MLFGETHAGNDLHAVPSAMQYISNIILCYAILIESMNYMCAIVTEH